MKDLGFDVCGLAANANQAIALAMEGEPDIAVMDIYLNGARDGIETARVLRDLCGVRVVFVTAYSNDEGLTDASRNRCRTLRCWQSPSMGIGSQMRSPSQAKCKHRLPYKGSRALVVLSTNEKSHERPSLCPHRQS